MPPARKNTSPVWGHFDVINTKEAKCRHCSKNISRAGGTTNLRNHLKIKHFAHYFTLEKEGAGGADTASNSETGLGSEDEDDPGTGASTPILQQSPGPLSPPSPTLSVCSVTTIASTSTQSTTSMSSPPPSPSPFSRASTTRFHQQSMDQFRTPDSRSQEKLHMAVAYYIATCNRPYNTVARKGFTTMLQAFRPGYVPVGRKAITETYIPRLYDATRNTIKALLAGAEYLAVTTDTWTSEAGESYISLTAHFIDPLWKLVSVTLSCRVLHENHTGVNIKDWINEELQEWGIPKSKVSAATTDNDDSLRLAFELLQILNVRCYGHTLQNGVQGALKIERIRKMRERAFALQHVFASNKLWRNYEKFVLKQYNSTPRKLRHPSKTRWWSELQLYCVIIEEEEYHRAFLATYEKGKHTGHLLTAEEMTLLKSYKATLDPLDEITRAMSAESYVTASAVLPFVYLTEGLLEAAESGGAVAEGSAVELVGDAEDLHEDGGNPEIVKYDAEILRSVVQKLQKRYNPPLSTDQGRDVNMRSTDYESGVKSHAFLAKCSFLDPRYKDDISANDRDLARSQLLAEMLAVTGNTDASNSTEATGADESPASIKRKGQGLGAVFAKFAKTSSTQPRPPRTTREDLLKEELQKYEHLPSASKDDDVLIWWRDHQSVFANLHKLAKRYLCVTATSTASERVFSKGGSVVTDERTLLTGTHAEQLIFLSMNEDYVPKPK